MKDCVTKLLEDKGDLSKRYEELKVKVLNSDACTN